MKVLVIGGAGYIGSHLVDSLLGFKACISLEEGLQRTLAWFKGVNHAH